MSIDERNRLSLSFFCDPKNTFQGIFEWITPYDYHQTVMFKLLHQMIWNRIKYNLLKIGHLSYYYKFTNFSFINNSQQSNIVLFFNTQISVKTVPSFWLNLSISNLIWLHVLESRRVIVISETEAKEKQINATIKLRFTQPINHVMMIH